MTKAVVRCLQIRNFDNTGLEINIQKGVVRCLQIRNFDNLPFRKVVFFYVSGKFWNEKNTPFSFKKGRKRKFF
jgi:hypothetical protein